MRFLANLIVVFLLFAMIACEQRHASLNKSACYDGTSIPQRLLFTSQDSIIFDCFSIDNDNSIEGKTTDFTPKTKNVIKVFDKLIFHAFLAENNNKETASKKYFDLANFSATYLALHRNDSLLIKQIQLYQKFNSDEILTKLSAECAYSNGYEHWAQGNDKEISEFAQQAYQSFLQIDDKKRVVDALELLTRATFLSNSYSQSEKYAVEALSVAELINYQQKFRVLHHSLSDIYYYLSQYQQARIESEKSLAFAENEKDTLWLAYTYQQLGFIYWRLDNYDKAMLMLCNARRFSNKLNKVSKISMLIAHGMVHRRLGNYKEAESSYEQALKLNGENESTDMFSIIINNWGGLFEELGDLQRALNMYEQAYQNETSKDSPNLVHRITYASNIGYLYSQLDNTDYALKYQREALTLFDQSDEQLDGEKAMIYVRLGDIYYKENELENAKQYYETALNISNKTKALRYQIAALFGLGRLSIRNARMKKALFYQSEVLRLAKTANSPEFLWNAYLELGKTYKAMNQIALARKNYELAIDRVENSRFKINANDLKMSFFAKKQEAYQDMILLQHQVLNDSILALYYSEKSRARSILDIMGEHWDELKIFSKIPSIRTLQSQLPEKTVFLEYKVFSDRLLIWFVGKNTLDIVNVPISKEKLNHKIRAFLNAIGATDYNSFYSNNQADPEKHYVQSLQLGKELYQYIISPIEKYLSSDQTIFVIPDDILFYLPFAALVIPDSKEQTYMIEKFTIAYVPSLATYYFISKRKRKNTKKQKKVIFAVGNPTDDLKYAEEEARLVAGMIPDSKLLIKKQANEIAVVVHLQSSIDYFHFAGHCKINPVSPLHSMLQLSQKRGMSTNVSTKEINDVHSDGSLTVRELMDISLTHIELAVLSGCETGLGKVVQGEGMMGLSQAFLGSGIKTLISSLWAIDDRISKQLMKRFYQYHLKQKYTKLKALRMAQLDVIHGKDFDTGAQHPFPYFWAAYVLNGLTD